MLATISRMQGRSVSHVSRIARPNAVLVAPKRLRTAALSNTQNRQTPHRNVRGICRAQAGTSALSYAETPSVQVMERGELSQFPATPGVYAVFDKEGTLQYIGLSRQVSQSVAAHTQELPELTHSVRVAVLESATRETLTDTWRQWVEAAVSETGGIPPGNAQGETKWQARSVARATKPEIKLTAGKPITGVTISDLLDQVVKTNKIVAFIKGTRQQPQCGFSNKLVTILNGIKVEYQVVNVLDEIHNPGLRDAIKTYSQWPTIPQLYVSGEFVGGSDIVDEMAQKGELEKVLRQ